MGAAEHEVPPHARPRAFDDPAGPRAGLRGLRGAGAKRYPSIHLWQIWSEPNRIGQFAITYYDSFEAKDGVYPLSPKQRDDVRRYAELVDAAYVSLKRHNRRNLIIGGMTAVGDITPLAWIRNLKAS